MKRTATAEERQSVAYNEKLFNQAQAIIAEQLGIDIEEIHLESDFVNDLGADSLDTVELITAFEEIFDIEITDETGERIRTVRDAIKYLRDEAKVSVVAA